MGRPGRPPRARSTLRTEQVGVALTAADALAIGKLARRRKVRPSVLARELVLDGLARLDEDPAQADQPRPPAETAASEAVRLRVEVLRLGTQVARVGANINQIAKSLHRSPAQVPDGLAARLDEVAGLVQSARELIAEKVS